MFTFCTKEDLSKISIGQKLKINARYENLKRENGQIFEFVAKKDEVVVVQRKTDTYLIVRFYEDVISLQDDGKEDYGEFVVEPNHIQKVEQ